MDEVWSRSGGDGTDALAAITGRWDYTTLPDNVHLGEGCFIESADLLAPFASTRHPGMVLGNRVRMYKGGWGGSLSVEAEGLLEIGDDSVLVGAQIMCAAHVSIGRRVIVSYNAVIADSDFHPRDPELRRSDAVSGAPYGRWIGFAPRYTAPVVLEDDVSVGINAIILKGTRIGAGATVFAGAVVTRDVAAGATVAGNPAIVIGGEG